MRIRRALTALALAVGFTFTGHASALADSTTRAEHLVTSERTYISVRLSTGVTRSLPKGSTFLGAQQAYNPAGCWLIIYVYNGGVFQYKIETSAAGWRGLPQLRHNKLRLDC